MSVTAMVELANTVNIPVVGVWLEVNTIIEPTSINVFSFHSLLQTLTSIDHPGYFGKVGMRYFHERKVYLKTTLF